MEVRSLANKCGKTRACFHEFTYTWMIENYFRLKTEASHVAIKSPLISVCNGNDKYEFQLNVSPGSNQFKIGIDLEVISCPGADNTTNVYVTTSNIVGNNQELNRSENSYSIVENTKINLCWFKMFDYSSGHYYKLQDLKLQFKFSFQNGLSNVETESAELQTAIAQSKMSILDEFENLFNSAVLADVTLIVGGTRFLAHKAILASRSPVFAAMFAHEMLENKENLVQIVDINPSVMREILRFIYSTKVMDIQKSTSDLFYAADKYQLQALRLMCEEVFIEKLNLSNLEEILHIVNNYETCHRLRNATLKYLSFNREAVTKWKKFDTVMKSLSPALMFEATKATLSKP